MGMSRSFVSPARCGGGAASADVNDEATGRGRSRARAVAWSSSWARGLIIVARRADSLPSRGQAVRIRAPRCAVGFGARDFRNPAFSKVETMPGRGRSRTSCPARRIERIPLDDPGAVRAGEFHGGIEQARVETLAAVLAPHDEAVSPPRPSRPPTAPRCRFVNSLVRGRRAWRVPGPLGSIPPPRRRHTRSVRAGDPPRPPRGASAGPLGVEVCGHSAFGDRPPLALAGWAIPATGERVLGIVETVGGRGFDGDVRHPPTLEPSFRHRQGPARSPIVLGIVCTAAEMVCTTAEIGRDTPVTGMPRPACLPGSPPLCSAADGARRSPRLAPGAGLG